MDGSGNVYIADYNNQRIRKVATGTGTISTVAGGGNKLGDEGPGTEAQLNYPMGVTAIAAGNSYIADTYNHRVRKLDTGGFIHTVAGTGESGFAGDGGTATGVRITATASGFVTGEIPVRVIQSQFQLDYLPSSMNLGLRARSTSTSMSLVTVISGPLPSPP